MSPGGAASTRSSTCWPRSRRATSEGSKFTLTGFRFEVDLFITVLIISFGHHSLSRWCAFEGYNVLKTNFNLTDFIFLLPWNSKQPVRRFIIQTWTREDQLLWLFNLKSSVNMFGRPVNWILIITILQHFLKKWLSTQPVPPISLHPLKYTMAWHCWYRASQHLI